MHYSEEHEKWGRPGLIHDVSDVRLMRGGCENDVRGRGQTCIVPMHALMRAQSVVSSIVIQLDDDMVFLLWTF